MLNSTTLPTESNDKVASNYYGSNDSQAEDVTEKLKKVWDTVRRSGRSLIAAMGRIPGEAGHTQRRDQRQAREGEMKKTREEMEMKSQREMTTAMVGLSRRK